MNPTMTPVPLPATDLLVSPLCLGAGEFGTSIKGDAADPLVAQFREADGNFFDTAHCYAFWVPGGLGASEHELAASLRRVGCLEQAVIATKGGHPDAGPDYPRPHDFLSEAVIASDIQDSLERLGVRCIPLYYLHRDDGRTPVQEIIGTLNRQIDAGFIRHIGASNWSVARIAEANAYAQSQGLRGFVASQVQGSLAEPNWQPTDDPTTRFLSDEDSAWHAGSGVPVVAYSATAGGYFAGRGHEKGLYANSTNQARYERVVALSERRGTATPTQIALAYLLHQPATIMPLFSTGDPAHLAEALGAPSVVLTAEETRWLRDG